MLFGGTFDPPHVAHVDLADLARRRVEADTGERAWLVFVPAARSPHKADPPEAGDRQRLEMVCIASAEVDRCAVWSDEIDRARAGEPSYWALTLERAAAQAGGATLWFVIGADQAAAFDRWRDPRGLLDRARPLVLPRGRVRDAAALREAMRSSGFWSDAELDAWRNRFVAVPGVRAASTDVREADGGPFETPLHPGVAAYARRHALYGMAADADAPAADRS